MRDKVKRILKRFDVLLCKYDKPITIVFYLVLGSSPIWIFVTLFCDYVASELLHPTAEEQLLMWIAGLVFGFVSFLNICISQERYIWKQKKCNKPCKHDSVCYPAMCKDCDFDFCEWHMLAEKGEKYYEEF